MLAIVLGVSGLVVLFAVIVFLYAVAAENAGLNAGEAEWPPQGEWPAAGPILRPLSVNDDAAQRDGRQAAR